MSSWPGEASFTVAATVKTYIAKTPRGIGALNYIFSSTDFFLVSKEPRQKPSGRDGDREMLASMDVERPASIPLPGPEASGDELFKLGMLYSTGQGGAPLDYVSAHMMFNLAAMRGSVEARVYRKELSQEMDQSEVAEAQRAAREWLASA